MANGFTFGHIEAARDRRRHIDARRGPRPVGIGRIGAVVRPRLQDLCRNRLAERDAIRFRRAIGDRRKIGREGDFHFTRCLCINCRQYRSGCRRGGGFLRRGGVRGQLHQIRSVAPLDRIDRVEHRGVDHRHHPLSHVWRRWRRALAIGVTAAMAFSSQSVMTVGAMPAQADADGPKPQLRLPRPKPGRPAHCVC